MLMACTPAIVTAVFPGGQRGRALGLVGTTVALGLTSGPPLGGLILGTVGWRGVFLINVPGGLLALALTRRLLPPLRLGRGREGYDLAGAALFTAACSLFLVALNQSREWGLWSPATLASGAAALLCLLAFLHRERVAASPLVDLSLFRNRSFSAAVAAATLSYQAGFVAVLLLPSCARRRASSPAAWTRWRWASCSPYRRSA